MLKPLSFGSGSSGGGGGNPFDQDLNTIDSVIFARVTAPIFGDGANYLLQWDAGNGRAELRNHADSAYVGLQVAGLTSNNGVSIDPNGYIQLTGMEISPTGWRFTGPGISMHSTGQIGFSSTTNFTSDTGLSRNAAGVVEINNGTPGTIRDIRVRNLFTSLPTADPGVPGQLWNDGGIVTVS